MSRLNYQNKSLNEYSEEKLALAALSAFPLFGPVILKKLKFFYGEWTKILKSSIGELLKIGLREDIAEQFIKFCRQQEPKKIIHSIFKEKLQLLTEDDKPYPRLLKEIPGNPPLLYVRGNINNQLLGLTSLTVVGSRKASFYGLQVTQKIVKAISPKILIVSGLALGIDTAAHQAALESKGATIAILGSGLADKVIYPPKNRNLAKIIEEKNGLLISEFPPYMPPLKQNFPRRNRLLAGWTSATLVIESGDKSGALITANLALDFNREVLAVPGNINSPYSLSSNRLIKSGAAVILEPEDVFEILKISHN